MNCYVSTTNVSCLLFLAGGSRRILSRQKLRRSRDWGKRRSRDWGKRRLLPLEVAYESDVRTPFCCSDFMAVIFREVLQTLHDEAGALGIAIHAADASAAIACCLCGQ